MPSEQATKSQYKARLWRCGDKSRFRIPRPSRDLWLSCVEPLLTEDKANYEVWKDEIQHLLVFAGLFSAAVTAFVVQSYQCLERSPTEVMLAHITIAVHQAVATSIPDFQYDEGVQASCIRVNILWFLSLILSLITVLVGIVSLQWLREYQKYPKSASSKRIFAMRAMRAAGFEKWFVPQIIAGLPLLLNVALIFFLAGLIDFLLRLSRAVAVPVIAVVVVAFLFMLVTTALPTLESFWMINSSTSERTQVPVQCPYKSPQSWAFLRFMSSSLIRWILAILGIMLFQMFLIEISLFIMILRWWNPHRFGWAILDRFRIAFQLKPLRTFQGWSNYDEFWLDERQRVATDSGESAAFFKKMSGDVDYDAARGIAQLVGSGVRDESVALAVYHCFQSLSPLVVVDEIFDSMLKDCPLG